MQRRYFLVCITGREESEPGMFLVSGTIAVEYGMLESSVGRVGGQVAERVGIGGEGLE